MDENTRHAPKEIEPSSFPATRLSGLFWALLCGLVLGAGTTGLIAALTFAVIYATKSALALLVVLLAGSYAVLANLTEDMVGGLTSLSALRASVWAVRYGVVGA